MEELFNLGISLVTISSMFELNPDIKDMSNIEIQEKVELLKLINCTEQQVINIISSNASYLSKTKEDYLKLISYLYKLGFNTLNVLFDSNPYILDLEPFEIERYIKEKQQEGMLLEDIVDELEGLPYLFNELI